VRATGALKPCSGTLSSTGRMMADRIALNITASLAPTASAIGLLGSRPSSNGNSAISLRITFNAASASSRVGFVRTSGNFWPSGSSRNRSNYKGQVTADGVS
jgi:hypothetical protein